MLEVKNKNIIVAEDILKFDSDFDSFSATKENCFGIFVSINTIQRPTFDKNKIYLYKDQIHILPIIK